MTSSIEHADGAGGAHQVSGILDRLREKADGGSTVSVADVVETFGQRSIGPFLLVPAAIELTPIGSIPGVPTVLAAIIILFSLQVLIGRTHLWLPQLLERRTVRSDKIRKAAEWLQPIARFCDRWFHGRLVWLTKRPFVQVAAAACILLSMTVPFLEIVPFASSAPMGAIALFGLALLVRDGLLMLLAGGIAALAIYVVGVIFL